MNNMTLLAMTAETFGALAGAWFLVLTGVIGGLALLVRNVKPAIKSILGDIDEIKKRQDRQGDRIDKQGDKLADVALKTPTIPVAAPAPIVIQVPAPVVNGNGSPTPVEVKNENPIPVKE